MRHPCPPDPLLTAFVWLKAIVTISAPCSSSSGTCQPGRGRWKQVEREHEFELIVAALADDGRFVVVYRAGHFGDVWVAAFHLADLHLPRLRVEAL
jgi:hypothetical protein